LIFFFFILQNSWLTVSCMFSNNLFFSAPSWLYFIVPTETVSIEFYVFFCMFFFASWKSRYGRPLCGINLFVGQQICCKNIGWTRGMGVCVPCLYRVHSLVDWTQPYCHTVSMRWYVFERSSVLPLIYKKMFLFRVLISTSSVQKMKPGAE